MNKPKCRKIRKIGEETEMKKQKMDLCDYINILSLYRMTINKGS